MEEIINHPYPVPEQPAPGMHIWGLVGPGELRWLSERAAQMSSIVEVGCMHGRSSYALLAACKGPVYCIDPWDDANPEEYLNPPGKMYDEFVKNCGHFPNLRIVRGFSPAAGDGVPEDPDMAWIDGRHEFGCVIADVDYWGRRTTKLICGHDYGSFKGVQDAVNQFSRWIGLPIEFTGLPGDPIWYINLMKEGK